MVDMTGWNQRKKKEWCYPGIESARQPILHCAEVSVPTFTSLPHLTKDETLLEVMEDTDSSCSNYSSTSMATEASSLSTNPKSFIQGQLNGLVHDFNLSKESSEILASRLGEHVYWIQKLQLHFSATGMIWCSNFLLWKMTLYIVITSQAFLQKWVSQIAIQTNGHCSLTAPNEA